MLDKNKKLFLMGFQFDFKKLWIPILFLDILFVFFSIRLLIQYHSYMNGQPSYASLKTIYGTIISDKRAPPKPYNRRHDGIYIQTNDGNMNIYCDNPQRPLNSFGASNGGGTYGLGQCTWIALKRERQGFCAEKNAKLCQDPRFFYGKEVVVKINDKQTIYELTIDKTEKIYSYEDMIDMYKNNYISESIVNHSVAIILFVVGLISFRKWLKARKSKKF